jgi:hypothetical protein
MVSRRLMPAAGHCAEGGWGDVRGFGQVGIVSPGRLDRMRTAPHHLARLTNASTFRFQPPAARFARAGS